MKTEARLFHTPRKKQLKTNKENELIKLIENTDKDSSIDIYVKKKQFWKKK